MYALAHFSSFYRSFDPKYENDIRDEAAGRKTFSDNSIGGFRVMRLARDPLHVIKPPIKAIRARD